MLKRYEKFLIEFDKELESIFNSQNQYLKCKKGCSKCCEFGDYPFSQLEFSYLTKGYLNLDYEKRLIVQQNIKKLLSEKEKNTKERFEHICPFLVNNECAVYDYRGLVCRTFGVCYYDDEKGFVKVPECVNFGLNYDGFYNEKTKELKIPDIPNVNLRIDKIFESETAKKYNIDSGQIRPMLDWMR